MKEEYTYGNDPDELIDTSMMLIVHSGDARAAAFHALQEAKAGNYEEAKKADGRIPREGAGGAPHPDRPADR